MKYTQSTQERQGVRALPKLMAHLIHTHKRVRSHQCEKWNEYNKSAENHTVAQASEEKKARQQQQQRKQPKIAVIYYKADDKDGGNSVKTNSHHHNDSCVYCLFKSVNL